MAYLGYYHLSQALATRVHVKLIASDISELWNAGLGAPSPWQCKSTFPLATWGWGVLFQVTSAEANSTPVLRGWGSSSCICLSALPVFVPSAAIETRRGTASPLRYGLSVGGHGMVSDKALLWPQAADRCAGQHLKHRLCLAPTWDAKLLLQVKAPRWGAYGGWPSAQAGVTATEGPHGPPEPLGIHAGHREPLDSHLRGRSPAPAHQLSSPELLK